VVIGFLHQTEDTSVVMIITGVTPLDIGEYFERIRDFRVKGRLKSVSIVERRGIIWDNKQVSTNFYIQ
jgi:hypothetical protein